MDSARARHILEESLSRGSSTPCSWAESREAYIAEKSDQLRSALIEPVSVVVKRSLHQTELLARLSPYSVFAIARLEDHWLLYVEELREFALAFGQAADEVAILGFSSDDALTEWLG